MNIFIPELETDEVPGKDRITSMHTYDQVYIPQHEKREIEKVQKSTKIQNFRGSTEYGKKRRDFII